MLIMASIYRIYDGIYVSNVVLCYFFTAASWLIALATLGELLEFAVLGYGQSSLIHLSNMVIVPSKHVIPSHIKSFNLYVNITCPNKGPWKRTLILHHVHLFLAPSTFFAETMPCYRDFMLNALW